MTQTLSVSPPIKWGVTEKDFYKRSSVPEKDSAYFSLGRLSIAMAWKAQLAATVLDVFIRASTQ